MKYSVLVLEHSVMVVARAKQGQLGLGGRLSVHGAHYTSMGMQIYSPELRQTSQSGGGDSRFCDCCSVSLALSHHLGPSKKH